MRVRVNSRLHLYRWELPTSEKLDVSGYGRLTEPGICRDVWRVSFTFLPRRRFTFIVRFSFGLGWLELSRKLSSKQSIWKDFFACYMHGIVA